MGLKEFFATRAELGVFTLSLFGLVALGGIAGAIQMPEDPVSFPGLLASIVLLVLVGGNMFVAQEKRKDLGYSVGRVLSIAAILILVGTFAAAIYYTEIADSEADISETLNATVPLLFGLMIASLIVPGKWVIGSGPSPPKTKAGKPIAAKKISLSVVEAIKLPFTDLKKLAIAAALSIGLIGLSYFVPMALFVSFIPALAVAGYLVRAAKETYEKGSYTLPEWNNWGNLFGKGIAASIICGIYLIPLFAFNAMSVSAILASPEPAALLQQMYIGAIVIILAIDYVLGMALVFYAIKGNFGAAFKFGEIFKKILTVEYFKNWAAILVYSGVLSYGILLAFSPITSRITELGPMESEAKAAAALFMIIMLTLLVFVVYLASMAQMAAFAGVYKKLE